MRSGRSLAGLAAAAAGTGRSASFSSAPGTAAAPCSWWWPGRRPAPAARPGVASTSPTVAGTGRSTRGHARPAAATDPGHDHVDPPGETQRRQLRCPSTGSNSTRSTNRARGGVTELASPPHGDLRPAPLRLGLGLGLITLDTAMIAAPGLVWPMAAAVPVSLLRIGTTVRAVPAILSR
jgi:hypothetical protein